MDKYESAIVSVGGRADEIDINSEMMFKSYVLYYSLKIDTTSSFSRYAYYLSFDKNVFPSLGEKSISEISGEDIKQLVDALFKRLNHNSVWCIFRRMRSIFRQAVADQIVKNNPCDALKNFRFEPINQQRFSDEELALIHEAVAHTEIRYMYELCLACGIKRSEMLGLRWSDVDYVNKKIYVRQVPGDLRQPYYLKDISGRGITYEITDKVSEILSKIRRNQSYSFAVNSADLVFANELGDYIHYSRIERCNQYVRDKTGIRDFSFRRISTHVKLAQDID